MASAAESEERRPTFQELIDRPCPDEVNSLGSDFENTFPDYREPQEGDVFHEEGNLIETKAGPVLQDEKDAPEE